MGYGAWAASHYDDRSKVRALSGDPVFKYTADVISGKVDKVVNDLMNPKGVTRESRDSATHPESRAVAVLFDVTGSMASVPGILQANLPKLMSLILSKGYLTDPQVLIGAIGDATCDAAPLQVGQFESDIKIDQDLEKLYLEGGGGGHNTESYELAMYFMAKHTVTDCFEKRKQKGYLFFIGDENPYSQVSKDQIKSVIGDSVQHNISLEDMMTELKEKWDVYYILPKMTNHWDDSSIKKKWTSLVGQNFLKLEEPNAVCELIAAAIGIVEGYLEADSVAGVLVDAGTKANAAEAVGRALVAVGANAIAEREDSGTGLVKL